MTSQFKQLVMPHVDKYLGRRCSLVGYQYSEILLAMACNFFTGGNRTEDINVLKKKLPQHPDFNLCSPDTVLRVLSELAVDDINYEASNGNSYRFNTAECLNGLLVYVAVKNGMLVPGRKYDLDFDHEFLESETWEALPTYKGFSGFGRAVPFSPTHKVGWTQSRGLRTGMATHLSNSTKKTHCFAPCSISSRLA